MTMLERFTEEEIEQLRKELSIPRRVPKTVRQETDEFAEWKKTIEKICPFRIVVDEKRSVDTPFWEPYKLVFNLADAIIGNYIASYGKGTTAGRVRFALSRGIPAGQEDEYKSILEGITDAIKKLYDEHEATRKENISTAAKAALKMMPKEEEETYEW